MQLCTHAEFYYNMSQDPKKLVSGLRRLYRYGTRCALSNFICLSASWTRRGMFSETMESRVANNCCILLLLLSPLRIYFALQNWGLI